MWLTENERPKFRLNVLVELKKRGLNDAPHRLVSLMLLMQYIWRPASSYVSWNDYKAVILDLKDIYQVFKHWKRSLQSRTVTICR